MPKKSDDCIMPIRELNKLTELRRAVLTMMHGARFCGEPILSIAKPSDAHSNSRCTVQLRAALRVRDLLNKSQ